MWAKRNTCASRKSVGNKSRWGKKKAKKKRELSRNGKEVWGKKKPSKKRVGSLNKLGRGEEEWSFQ